jgi:hypothetical protein
MGLSVNGGPELTPRTLVTSVPYAMRASFADAAELNGPWVNLYWPGETPYLDFITTPNRDYDYRVSVQTPSDPRLVFSSDIQPETLVIRRNGYVGIGLALPSAALDIAGDLRVRDGASVGVLTIRGADVAERFDIANAEKGLKPQPGMIVSIDSKNPGKLRVSTTPYDKKVAGAISGAGGLSVGVVMGNENADPLIAGEHPVAMSGRVYVWCDAAFGSIAPGDRLTASSTPGHAMKAVDPTQCDGAVIGKAMTELTGGRGLVLVLVNLQ